ncbi:hypothetical protein [Mycoplasmopsis bovis]
MAIPKDILKIPRPSSTRVKATSKEGIYNVIIKVIPHNTIQNVAFWTM